MHFPAIDLATDPVSNVRLKLCGLLLPLKRTLRLPADAQALELIHLGSVALQADPSCDVRAAAAAVQPALGSVEVLMEGAVRRATSAGNARREALDVVLQAEEEAMRSEEERASAEKERLLAAGGVRRRRNSRELQPLTPGFDARGGAGAGASASCTSIEGAMARSRGPSNRSTATASVGAIAPGDAVRRQKKNSKELQTAPAHAASRTRRSSKDQVPTFN